MYLSKEVRKKKLQKEREPKVIENAKHSLLWQQTGSGKCSELVRRVLQDFSALRKPLSTGPTKIHLSASPFDDAVPVEREGRRRDASLFAVGSHSRKKRPHNLVLGRLYDGQVLDMVEFGVSDYRPMHRSARAVNVADGSKPCLLFQGDAFTNDERAQRVMNLLLDFFRGDTTARSVNVLGLDHVIVVTALSSDVLRFDHCAVRLSKCGGGGGGGVGGAVVPKVDLVSVGPSMNLTVRRTKLAPADLWREATRVPQQLRRSASRNKNILVNPVTGERHGRIHVEQQPIHEIALRRFKSLKRGRQPSDGDAGDDVGSAARFDAAELDAARRGGDHSGASGSGSSKRHKTLAVDGEDGLSAGRNMNRPMRARDALQETMDEFQ